MKSMKSKTLWACLAVRVALNAGCSQELPDDPEIAASEALLNGTGAGAAGSPAHAGHGAQLTAAASGPRIDRTAIPTGSSGVDRPMLTRTSERPGSSDGTGAFRTVCSYSHMNFDDPIVYPNQPGKAHLHAYFGNTGAKAASTANSLATTGNSTCRGGTINRSAYWAPALIDSAGRPLKPASLEVYYKSGYGGVAAKSIRSFPRGLRMVAGDMRSTSTQWNAYWGCRDHYIGKPGSIPRCNSGEDIAMIVEFPQCWDGRNLDSADHKSHMAYPARGGCPSTHPVPIPAITMNVIYKPGTATGLRLSSDMYDTKLPGGYSAHADWFGAWDPAIVDTFVSKCINPALDCHSHLLGDGRAMQ
ncbi:MAG TPA: DUF1996 domain-containing protein [Polyangiales bacterium]|nr:DUF1996 domain-containing protein [Polyangiales bacterium]